MSFRLVLININRKLHQNLKLTSGHDQNLKNVQIALFTGTNSIKLGYCFGRQFCVLQLLEEEYLDLLRNVMRQVIMGAAKH